MSKYKNGDKVRVIEDVVGCSAIKKGDIVDIDCVEQDKHYVKGHTFADGYQYYLNRDEFELAEEPSGKRYVWYLDSEDETYFLNNLLGVDKWTLDETKEIKNGKDMCYMLTEEEARKSPFFDKFAKHDPSEEKLYYIRMKGNQKDYLISNTNDGEYFMYDNDEYIPFKSTFTEEECNEIIGNSSILYKEECR